MNERYNQFCQQWADSDDETDNGILTGKRIPYIGWYWRDTDFEGKRICIGRGKGGYIGVMENNKWSYPDRLMTDDEVSQFIAYLERAMESENNEHIFAEMRAWFQSLIIEGEPT